MIEKFLAKIENQSITISQWIVSFIGIFFIRFILEALSSPTRSGIIASNAITIVHYGLFWLTLTLGLILILGFFSKNYLFSSKIALFGLPAIWLAPILDILISRGNGYIQSYILDTGNKLFFDFVTFFGPVLNWGATYGIRIEMLLVLIGAGLYLKQKRQKALRIFLAIISIYTFGFILASWPGILHTISHIHNTVSTLPDVFAYFSDLVFKSNLSHNTLYEGLTSVAPGRFVELGFDKISTQILLIFSIFLSGILFWKLDSKKLKIILKNIRLERIGSYIALLISGIGFAYINGLGNNFIWVDFLGIVCLLLSWVSLWMYAVHNNDIADVDIDKISNTERPLVKKEVDEKDMRESGYVWLAMALLGSWSAGFYPFFMSLIYLFASHIYSNNPLRLRRFPMISSFLIGVASLATILAGFFFLSENKQIMAFPILLSLGIVIMVTLAINVKDMKDIAGDKANGILTLPVLFGKNGGKVVGLCFALSFLLVPIFLSFYFLYIIAIPAAVIGYKLVTKEPYREEPIFILRFAFLFLVGGVYITALWLAHILPFQ